MNPLSQMCRFLLSCSCITLLSLLWTGCGTAGPTPGVGPTSVPQVQARNTNDLSTESLRVGDLVTILFSGVTDPPTLRHEERIKADGRITLPLIGSVEAAGKTLGELRDAIRTNYVSRYYQRLTVNVAAETRVFYVDGMVRAPNRYPYVGEMTVLRGIAAAGGFTDFANKKKVLVTRASGEKLKVNCIEAQHKPAKDPPLYPDDQIWVPRRYF